MTKKNHDDWFASAQEEIIKDQQQDELEAEAEVWEPEAGDLLKGEFSKAVPYWKEYDGKQVLNYRLYVKDLERKDEPLVLVFVTRSVLKNELIDALPAQDSLLVIQYFGLIEGKSGRNYHGYKVRAQTSDPRYWKEVAEEANRVRPRVVVQPTQISPDMDPY